MGVDLKTFMAEQGFSQRQLARELGCTQPTLSALCTRSVDPYYSSVLRVARWAQRIATERGLPPDKRLDARLLEKLDRAA